MFKTSNTPTAVRIPAALVGLATATAGLAIFAAPAAYALPAGCTQTSSNDIVTVTCTQDATFVAPRNIQILAVKAIGAKGGNGTLIDPVIANTGGLPGRGGLGAIVETSNLNAIVAENGSVAIKVGTPGTDTPYRFSGISATGGGESSLFTGQFGQIGVRAGGGGGGGNAGIVGRGGSGGHAGYHSAVTDSATTSHSNGKNGEAGQSGGRAGSSDSLGGTGGTLAGNGTTPQTWYSDIAGGKGSTGYNHGGDAPRAATNADGSAGGGGGLSNAVWASGGSPATYSTTSQTPKVVFSYKRAGDSATSVPTSYTKTLTTSVGDLTLNIKTKVKPGKSIVKVTGTLGGLKFKPVKIHSESLGTARTELTVTALVKKTGTEATINLNFAEDGTFTGTSAK